jgi:hypothetical protein
MVSFAEFIQSEAKHRNDSRQDFYTSLLLPPDLRLMMPLTSGGVEPFGNAVAFRRNAVCP